MLICFQKHALVHIRLFAFTTFVQQSPQSVTVMSRTPRNMANYTFRTTLFADEAGDIHLTAVALNGMFLQRQQPRNIYTSPNVNK